jgi:hypothetical protein
MMFEMVYGACNQEARHQQSNSGHADDDLSYCSANPSIFHHLGAHNTCRRFALAAKEV